MVRLSITVDEKLLEEAQSLAAGKTKRQAIEQALQEFVQRRRIARLIELAGSGLVDLEPDDLRAWRQRATPEA